MIYSDFSDLSLNPLSIVFADFMMELTENSSPALRQILINLSEKMIEGHSCLCVDSEMREVLQAYPRLVGSPNSDKTPLILARDYLYTHRYYFYEHCVATEISKRIAIPFSDSLSIPSLLENSLLNYQLLSVFMAMNRSFSIITGGPGTGKTTTVIALISEILRANPDEQIVMCAPTGKAQSRLKDSLRDYVSDPRNSIPDTIRNRMDIEACTIHKLLGTQWGSTQFRYNAENPLPYTTVIVDECSMISLFLMAKLLMAVPPHARLVLLGDRNQLPSVEAGSLFADMCRCGLPNYFSLSFWEALPQSYRDGVSLLSQQNSQYPLSSFITELQINYRSKDAPLISTMAELIRGLESSEIQKSICALTDFIAEHHIEKGVPDLMPAFAIFSEKHTLPLIDTLLNQTIFSEEEISYSFSDLPRLAAHPTLENLDRAFHLIEEFKILCATRNGPYGVENINAYVSKRLGFDTPFAVGTPILITENDAEHGLFNGDVGIIWVQESAPNIPVCVFRDSQTQSFRFYPVFQLPSYDLMFAMTIHKSQGSGFTLVAALLPQEDSPILSRELVYTALTRAKKYFYFATSMDTLRKAFLRKTERFSGLYEQICELQPFILQ